MRLLSIAPVRQRGLTIVELMVSLVMSLILLAGVGQVYLSSKQSYRMNESLSRMQETGRFATDMLAREIRLAGFMPCNLPPSAEPAVTVNPGPAGSGVDTFLSFFGGALVGDDGSASSPSGSSADLRNSLPAFGTNDRDRAAGTDAFLILRGSTDDTYDVIHHVAQSAQFTLSANRNELRKGDFGVICDAGHAAVFQVSGPNSDGTENAVHNTGVSGVSPGNSTKFLGPGGSSYTFGPGSQLLKFEGIAYYIGISRNGSSRSLYRVRLGTGTLLPPEELIEGVENMQLLYGVDASPKDSFAERYVTAENVGSWSDVLNVRLGLLVRTPDEIAREADSRTYTVAGTAIGTSTAVKHDADKRLRYVFQTTVKLRNRATDN